MQAASIKYKQQQQKQQNCWAQATSVVILLLYYNKFTYINQQRRRLRRVLIIYPDAARASPFDGGGGGGLTGVPIHTVTLPDQPSHHCRQYILCKLQYIIIYRRRYQGGVCTREKGTSIHLLTAYRRYLASHAHYSYSHRRIIYP